MRLIDLHALFFPPSDPSLLATGSYDPWLVAPLDRGRDLCFLNGIAPDRARERDEQSLIAHRRADHRQCELGSRRVGHAFHRHAGLQRLRSDLRSGHHLRVAAAEHRGVRSRAVVDVFDALTSVRPYKTAWPVEEALAYLREQRGKHFDPALVDLFLTLIPAVTEVMQRWGEKQA